MDIYIHTRERDGQTRREGREFLEVCKETLERLVKNFRKVTENVPEGNETNSSKDACSKKVPESQILL